VSIILRSRPHDKTRASTVQASGGLAPDLIPGDCVIASAIIDYPAVRPTDPLWSRKLAEMIPDARHGPIMGVNAVVSDPADKRKLHAFTRAVAVDMESHLVARLAAAHGLALAAVRVIIDPAHRAGPACRFAGNGAGRQRGCQRHAAGDFGATLASLATDAARRRRHLRPRGACSPAPPAGAELQREREALAGGLDSRDPLNLNQTGKPIQPRGIRVNLSWFIQL
jgi:hypothetical protein